ncbi:hypothetical protein Tco_1562553 [Tanacetum coccineum]
MDVAEDRLLFQEGPAYEEDAGAKSDEDLNEVSDDDVLSDAVAISVDRIVVSGDDDPDGEDGQNLTLSLHLETM